MAVLFKARPAAMRQAGDMPDVEAAAQFVHGHGRLLERRRFDHLFGERSEGSAEAVVRALDAYRNADGGLGLLEPDVRTPASQPSAVLYALEILDEVRDDVALPGALTTGALDWIATIANADGGIPFILPSAQGWPHAPWWTPQPDPPSSLLMTAGVAAAAHRLGLHDHPWLADAADYVWNAMAGLRPGNAYAFRYTVHFLDATPDRDRAEPQLAALAQRMPADGVLAVEQGVEGETLSALDVAPRPGHAGRALFPDDLVERELDRLAAAQQDDGGWTFSWAAWNPAAAFEWRGVVTLTALTTLRAYGRLDGAALGST
jgi:hypothetical protein